MATGNETDRQTVVFGDQQVERGLVGATDQAAAHGYCETYEPLTDLTRAVEPDHLRRASSHEDPATKARSAALGGVLGTGSWRDAND